MCKSLKHDLDIVKHEIKGAEDLRKPIRKNNRNNSRRAVGFLDKTLDILEKHGCSIIPYIYIKRPCKSVNSDSLYTRSVQHLNFQFQNYLWQENDQGLVIADSRNHDLNVRVSHSVFTQKFKASGDAYPNVLEMPVYGHSENHVAIQMVDIICSALLFPISSYAYCTGYVFNVHVDVKYSTLQQRFSKRLRQMCISLMEDNRAVSSLTIKDSIGHRSVELF